MQDLKQLAQIIAKRRKMPIEEASKTLNDLVAGKTTFGAKLAIADYLDIDKAPNTTLPGLEDIDPILHIKE